MDTNHNARLTSTEITQLWTNYMDDSMAICIFRYFFYIVEDNEVKELVKYALDLAESHIPKLNSFFEGENYPVPIGFNVNEDVDVNAPRLYSDSYILTYIRDVPDWHEQLFGGYCMFCKRGYL
ncbi:DUF3231 family protein [Ornithinibacillus sp. FSL M8-0202]|uniref:DUF3231 family protein n=1 Tax=Ornithinibacillus sp. FSL M8-0202 TaxID=2921616 RepID=UPI0030D53082